MMLQTAFFAQDDTSRDDAIGTDGCARAEFRLWINDGSRMSFDAAHNQNDG